MCMLILMLVLWVAGHNTEHLICMVILTVCKILLYITNIQTTKRKLQKPTIEMGTFIYYISLINETKI